MINNPAETNRRVAERSQVGQRCRLLIALLVCLGAVASANADDGLVGHWEFDRVRELEPKRVFDSSPFRNDGQLVGQAAIRAQGHRGGALDLNPNNSDADYVTIPHDISLDLPNQLTIAAWLFVFELDEGDGIVSKGVELAPWSLALSRGGHPQFEVNHRAEGVAAYRNPSELRGQETVQSGLSIALEQWVHVAVTYDGATLAFFVNGVEERIPDRRYVFGKTTEPLILGAALPGEDGFFNGFIDDVRLYERALDGDSIKLMASEGLHAIDPRPANGAQSVAHAELTWWAPVGEPLQVVYLGTNRFVMTQVAFLPNFEQSFVTENLAPLMTYFWRVDQQGATETVRGEVWVFSTAPVEASAPSPASDAVSVPLDGLRLNWASGFGASGHRVYFGPSGAEMSLAATLEADHFAPPATSIEYDQGYSWRVDAVSPGGAVVPGSVWRFRTAPYVPPDPCVVAWYWFDEGAGHTSRDWSDNGLDARLEGNVAWSAEGKSGWAADLTGDGYIQMPVGRALQGVHDFTLLGWFLQEQPSEGTPLWSLGRDAEHSISLRPNLPGADSFLFESRATSGGVDREGGTGERAFPQGEWTHSALRLDMDLRHATVFENGQRVLEVEDIRVDPAFLHEHGGMPANYLGRSHEDDGAFFRGRIDDVRLYRKALSDTTISRVVSGDLAQAWGPTPASGEKVDRETPITLTWEAGYGAFSHELYVGTHPSALTYQGPQRRRRFALGLVEGGTTHYWRVDTRFANGAVRRGVVWDFSVALHLVVDNMELYTDDPGSRIWDQWIDGIVTANGSTVGYNEPPYVELETVHAGRQAMPFIYDNSGEYGFYSQAFLDLGLAQDWTRHGMRALALHFWGDNRNTVAESDILSVGIADASGNEAFVPLENSTVELKEGQWHQWNVDLARFTDVDLTAVQRIFLRVGDAGSADVGGQGLLIVDDIQLWPPRCIGVPEPPDLNGDCRVDNYDLAILTSDWLASGELYFPQDPGPDDLMSHWPLDGDAVDEIGGHQGIMLGGRRATGVVGDAIEFLDEEWVFLGDTTASVGQAIAELDSFTAGIWARPALIGGRWQRLFDFGNGTTDYLMLAAFDGFPTEGGTPRFHLRVDDASQGPSSDVPLKPHEWQHVTARLNADTRIATIWINGVKTGEALVTHRPRELGRTNDNFFGKSQWHGDGTFVGRLDEFRLYRRALTDLEIRYLAGLTEPYTDLGEAAASDLNTDGRVDALDLEILTEAWLRETLWPSP